MNFIHSALDKVRDRYALISHTSTFRETGQLTPDEFLLAGDFLVYKFPSWSWSDASHPSKRVSYLPPDKQFLVTRGVPCHRRLDEGYKTADGEQNIQSEGDDGEEGWLATGGGKKVEPSERDVKTLDGSGNIHASEHEDQEEEIPDIEDEEDDSEAIIRDNNAGSTKTPLRTYTLYITYTPYYRTPRFYLSGYQGASNQPLDPTAMMEDIMGDYKDKTVTLEDFPFFDATQSVKMASIHPCRHASVMKSLLDRADAALKLRRERAKAGKGVGSGGQELGMEGLVDETDKLALDQATDSKSAHKAGVAAAGGNGGDEWEVLQHEGDHEEDGSAIRVDQYLVVFLKFAASVTPTIEYDFTMGV